MESELPRLLLGRSAPRHLALLHTHAAQRDEEEGAQHKTDQYHLAELDRFSAALAQSDNAQNVVFAAEEEQDDRHGQKHEQVPNREAVAHYEPDDTLRCGSDHGATTYGLSS